MKNSFVHRYAIIMILLFADVIWLSATGFLALWIRFDFSIPYLLEDFWAEQIRVTPIIVATVVAIYYMFRLYHSLWRFASVMELARIVSAYIAIVPVVAVEVLVFHIHLPRSVYLIAYILDFLGCVGVRFAYRFIRELSRRRFPASETSDLENVMMIGAGEAARDLLSDIAVSNRVHYRAVCVIDDNPDTWNRYIGSVPIVGGRDSIVDAAEKYAVDRIIFAIPTATGVERSEILEICRQTHCRIQVIPGMYELLNEDLTVSRLKDVDVTDLLGRDTNILEHQSVLESITGKIVLVTGGGGSIGSELCRQIALAQPQQLIIFDIYENNAYAIEQELRRKFPELNLVVLIGSVRNTNRVNHVLHTYKPDVIYHAAAHKHVPLMETSPIEAIKNNVFGTYKLARAAARAKTKRFLLISTDKAVNPTNVMGASKRVCELVIQFLAKQYTETTFCAVRFGNVLGSNGSVIPLFREQIKNGGPVTVTDPRIIRYFMTIPEAVSLVLVAGHYAKGGEVFVLDMGQPVRIDDMARKMIELSGFTPDVDIQIEYTGLRPGEKMYEELLVDKETMRQTENKKIFIEQTSELDDKQFRQDMTRLGALAKKEDQKAVDLLWEMIGGKFEPQI
ncbi:MAG: polysaccharide biosynthesis protein [Lachnospiraceae bacterium]|nr:polysaccharide biosynthesis protein [Lachnospiraceae bacterium]